MQPVEISWLGGGAEGGDKDSPLRLEVVAPLGPRPSPF